MLNIILLKFHLTKIICLLFIFNHFKTKKNENYSCYSHKRKNKNKKNFKKKKAVTINLDEEEEEENEKEDNEITQIEEKSTENKIKIENIEKNEDLTLLNKKTNPPKDNIEDNYNNEKDNKFFDINNLYKKNFITNENIITSINLNKQKHYYVFLKEEFNINKNQKGIFKIIFRLLTDVDWLGVGICDKKLVEENNYVFDDEKIKNNGTYLLSVNSVSWNANNHLQEKRKIVKKELTMLQKAGTIIECTFYPDKGFLDFSVANISIIRLTNIELFKSESYTPCIIFLKNCSVEISLEYP